MKWLLNLLGLGKTVKTCESKSSKKIVFTYRRIGIDWFALDSNNPRMATRFKEKTFPRETSVGDIEAMAMKIEPEGYELIEITEVK